MDLTYIPVKEPATAARGGTGGCLIACFGVYSGIAKFIVSHS